MSEFDLDLGAIEQEMDEFRDRHKIVLGILDGTIPGEAWIREIDDGNVLVLAVEGDLNELARGFAREIRDRGGSLMHFREFLIVTPPDVTIDRDRLGTSSTR